MATLDCGAKKAPINASRRRAVTLLILLARTAGTGIVAADLGLAAHDGFDFAGFLAGGRRTLIWAGEIHRVSPGGTAALQFVGLLFGDDLQIKERSDGESVDAIKHRLEHVETFFLIFNQRILLAIADQADALL